MTMIRSAGSTISRPRRLQSIQGSDVLGVVMLMGAMVVRPSLFGEELTPVGSVIIFGCGFTNFLLYGYNRNLLYLTLRSQLSAILFWLFLTIHSLMNGVWLTFGLTAFMTVSMCCAGACLGFSNKRLHDTFFLALRVFLALCALSYLITAVLSASVGLMAIYLGTLSVKNYDIAGYSDVYFPLTISYGYKVVLGVLVPRAGAGFREAGIAQAFYAFAILTIPVLRSPRQWLLLALLVVGGLGTLSTTGLAIVGVAASIRILMVEAIGIKLRIIVLAAVSCLALISIDYAINDKDVGFAAKLETDSYLDRERQTTKGIEYFLANPMGAGVYSPEVGVGINLLASSGSIGIFGLAGVAINLLMAVFGSVSKIRKALSILPLFITALTSQPLLDAPFVYICYGYLAFGADMPRPFSRKGVSRSKFSFVPSPVRH